MWPTFSDTYFGLWHNKSGTGPFHNFKIFDIKDHNNGLNNFNKYGSQRPVQTFATGTSVIGIKFKGGVIIAADNLVSYGSLARFQNVQRVYKINEISMIGCGGEYADCQWIKRHIDQKTVEDICYNDNLESKPKALYTWLTKLLYNRRSQLQPLLIDILIGGLEDGEPFLGHIDLRGRSFEDKIISTGFGKYLAVPLIRKHLDEKELPTEEKATEVLKKTMEVLYYRDTKAISTYTIVTCTSKGTTVYENLKVNQNWGFAEMVVGY